MYSHMMVGSNDIDRSKQFYDATFKAIGGARAIKDDKGRLIYSTTTALFLVTPPIDGQPATHGNGCTVGFAMLPEQADAWHQAGVANGGRRSRTRRAASGLRRCTSPTCAIPTATSSARCIASSSNLLMRGEAGLMADLAALDIPFAAHEHAAVFSVAESRRLDAGFPGAHTKNLFLKDTAGAFWLMIVPADARIDLKALPQAIGCKRVSFTKPDDMQRLLGITPGSVTPLAIINSAPGSVTVVVEEGLATAERINVHPLRNTGTLGLAGADVLRLLRHWSHNPVVAAIPTAG